MLDGRFRFDNYVVGASNRLAASAARAVAESPGAVYNPLVIYSASGLGKTHLLAALGHAIAERHTELSVQYITLEDFVDQLHGAVATGHADLFARRFQDVHVLLLDDLQFLTGRRETQSEVLRLFNAFQASGRQMVMACDRPPSEIADVDERLLSRMAGGLIVDIDLPDYETRVAILRSKCAERGLTFEPSILEELASAPARSVRELQGALHRAMALQSLRDSPAAGAVATSSTPTESAPDEYESFLSEIATTLSQSVDPGRIRLGESIARWSSEGFRTVMLERALEATVATDFDALEARFAAAVTRLRALQAEAARLDDKLAAFDAFRDPERLAEAEAMLHRALAAYDPPPAPDPRFSIDTFVAGERNQLALRGAGEVIAVPATRYNPLYIYGKPGVGKTHLLHAIGNALARHDGGGWTVACLSAATFTDEVIAALQQGTLDRWRMRYRAVDALLIDDVQALGGKDRSQEELFHLFNALQEGGKQVVIAAATVPSHLLDVAARLRSRFDGGLVVELGLVPEAERVARHTPVPDGDEAAAPTIDAWFDEHAGAPPAVPPRSSGVGDSFFLDPEKCLIDWPGIEGRVIEDLR